MGRTVRALDEGRDNTDLANDDAVAVGSLGFANASCSKYAKAAVRAAGTREELKRAGIAAAVVERGSADADTAGAGALIAFLLLLAPTRRRAAVTRLGRAADRSIASFFFSPLQRFELTDRDDREGWWVYKEESNRGMLWRNVDLLTTVAAAQPSFVGELQ
jgi:hypothetical protein